MAVNNITNDTFKTEVLDNEGVVFVDFHAEWCGPCKFTEPIVDELAQNTTYKDKIKFVKVDVDQNNELAMKYSVFSIPTFMIFKGGQPMSQFVGARDRAGFVSELDKSLG